MRKYKLVLGLFLNELSIKIIDIKCFLHTNRPLEEVYET